MAISLKNDEIFKLLSQYKFVVISDINENYKCGICKNILLNAHQATCGCHFCYECVNQYIANGTINCPNNTDECGAESLSNIAPNYRLNRLISNIVVQCPNNVCLHECRLTEMENHLNSCANISVKCPFKDVGCEHDGMINHALNDHMLSNIHNHNKILIDLVGNLRNEMRELKAKVEVNRSEIEILKESDHKKTEIIESLKEEIKIIKQNNGDLTQQREISDRNLWYKFDKIDIEMKEKCKNDSIKSINEEVHLIKMAKEELSQKVLNIEKNINNKYNIETNETLSNMKQNWNEKLENVLKIIEENVKFQTELKSGVNDINKFIYMRHHGYLKLEIEKINEIQGMQMSEYFYDRKNPYKMRVGMRNANQEFIVTFYMHSGEFDDDLTWPCKPDVTIQLNSDADIFKLKSMTKYCIIKRPTSIFPLSIPFTFTHAALTEANIFDVKCFIRCRVKFVPNNDIEQPS